MSDPSRGILTATPGVEEDLRAQRRDRLLWTLRGLAKPGDPEIAHSAADDALLAYINDPEIIKAFDAIEKWYA